MGPTASDARPRPLRSLPRTLRILCFAAPLGFVSAPARAGEWQITPSLELAEIYSDNIGLARSGREEGEFVTEITPGVSVRGEGARLRAAADYRLQNLFYLDESEFITNHRFAGSATAELAEDALFLDADGTATQVLLEPEVGFGGGNIARANRTDVYTLRMSPYYVQDLGGFARFLARYTYGITRFEEGVSDSDLSRIGLSLGSGRHFTRFGWNLDYYDQSLDRERAAAGVGGGDVDSQVATFNARYALTERFSLLYRAGDEEHEFEVPISGFENGSYQAGGFAWQIGRHSELQALYGDRYRSAALLWEPTTRTTLNVSWRDTEVGLNVGQAWDADLSLTTRRTRWTLRYLEETSTVQQLAFQNRVFLYQHPLTGDIAADPLPGYIPVAAFDIFDLTNEVFTRKAASFSVGFLTGRTSVITRLFDEERDYLSSGNREEVTGVSTSAQWRFAVRTSLTGGASFARRDPRLSDIESDYWHVEAGLLRRMSPRSTATLIASHRERDSEASDQDFAENRLELRLVMQF